jgi:4-amino-4-deoxy-L-arabinose transferase-like glycosyltransferase
MPMRGTSSIVKLTKETVFLIIVICLGLFLRFYDLGRESIWLDEGISIYRAHFPVIEIIKQLLWDNHPPLYFSLLHFWVFVFGDSEIAVRSLSALFSFFALFAMYRIGSLVFDRHTGMLSTFLLAISVFHLRYAQEARSYSLMAFLTLLSMYYFFRLLERENLKASMMYIASSLLLLFTHHHGIFVLLAQNVFYFTTACSSKDKSSLNLKKWFIIQSTILFLYMPWILPWISILVVRILNHQSGTEWIPVPTYNTLVNTLSVYSGVRSSEWLYILLAITGFIYGRKSRNTQIPEQSPPYPAKHIPVCRNSIAARTYFLLLWLAISIMAPFVISLLFKPVYHVRYTISASLAFYILVAKGIGIINNRLIRYLVIIIIIALASLSIGGYYTNVNKKPWREAIRHIDLKAGEGDLILYVPGASLKMLHTYYSGRRDLRAEGFPSYWEKIDNDNVKKLEPAVDGSDHVWLVLSFHLDPERLIVKTMKEMNFLVKNSLQFPGITIYEFRRANYPTSQ